MENPKEGLTPSWIFPLKTSDKIYYVNFLWCKSNGHPQIYLVTACF